MRGGIQEDDMERIIIRHLSGSKANQEASFPLDQVQEISLGRDAASTVAYDSERDDAVSRNHARITRDPAQPKQFILTDLGSRNGVFVNKARIAGNAPLHHDDVVQLGAGGPEFRFQFDPPPAATPKATRQIDLGQQVPSREIPPGAPSPLRVVLRHLSGSKAHQEVNFPVERFTEISFGRDPASTVPYDAEHDDTVSRNHATLTRDPVLKIFTLNDLNSRNGVFVNGARISGSVALHHGDTIQFGAGGPELAFQLDPPPSGAPRATRQFEPPRIQPSATREAPLPPLATSSTASFEPPPGPRGVGRETVERLIGETKTESRKTMINVIAALLAVVALVAGVFVFMSREAEKKIEVAKSEAEAAASKAQATSSQAADTAKAVKAMQELMTPSEIAAKFGPATVYIEASWKLIDTGTGNQIYHGYMEVKKGNKKPVYAPIYIQYDNNRIEPLLMNKARLEEGGMAIVGVPIGFPPLRGSGFAVTRDGFILSNKHVVAPWTTIYVAGLQPGFLVGNDLQVLNANFDPGQSQKWNWVPENSELFRQPPGEQKRLAGRHDRLDVTFANNSVRIPGTLVRVSPQHDAALIKIDTPAQLTRTELAPPGSETKIRPGDPITVLGYPGTSPDLLMKSKSRDLMTQGTEDVVQVPIPTVTPGAIGKLIVASSVPGSRKIDYYNEQETYQLTANATEGNSGGPVFDEHGQVIGIFYARSTRDMMTLAVPIKFGRELMEVKAVR